MDNTRRNSTFMGHNYAVWWQAFLAVTTIVRLREGKSIVIENEGKHAQSCCFSTRSTLIPSFLASARIACLTTAVCVMPNRSESFLSRVLSASLKRIVVVLFIIFDSVSHVVYNASTYKLPARAGSVRVVASSARKNACGGWTALAQQCVKRRPVKQVLKRGYTRFPTF
jgi:hypothetical protein